MPKPLATAVAVRNEKTPGRHPIGETLYLMVWPTGGEAGRGETRGDTHLRAVGPAAHSREPAFLEEPQTQSAVGIDPSDLRLSEAWRSEGERDRPQAGGRSTRPHLDHQGRDRKACPTTHSLRHRPGHLPGIRRLQPCRGRHQRRPRQAASHQESPSRSPVPEPAGSSPSRSVVHCQPVGQAGFRDAGVDGLPLR